MKDKLLQLKKLYKEVTKLQYEINAAFHDKSLSIDEKFKNDNWKDGYDFKIDKVNIEENDIEILFYVDEIDDPKLECVDGVSVEQFIKYFEIPGFFEQ